MFRYSIYVQCLFRQNALWMLIAFWENGNLKIYENKKRKLG